MIVLWAIAGFIIGWTLIEVVAVSSKVEMPYTFNIGIGLVGALAAYTLMAG